MVAMLYRVRPFIEVDNFPCVKLLNNYLSFGLMTPARLSELTVQNNSYVVDLDHEIVGFINAQITEMPPDVCQNFGQLEGHKVFTITHLVLHPDHRNQGIAKKLVEVAMKGNIYPVLREVWLNKSNAYMLDTLTKQGYQIQELEGYYRGICAELCEQSCKCTLLRAYKQQPLKEDSQ